MIGEKLRVLFVCSGNMCRSPLGAALLKRELGDRGITGVVVESAGILSANGGGASELALEVGLEHGLNLSLHRTRQVDERMLEAADLIVAVTGGHAEHLAQRFPPARQKTVALDIPDPYGLLKDTYEVAFTKLEEAMPIIIEEIRDRLGLEELS